MLPNSIRLGLRVDDVTAAQDFYAGLGFNAVAQVPDEHGRPLLAILEHDGFHLIVESLTGVPMPDSPRERNTQNGPRGLGVAIGFGADDLDAVYRYCIEHGCEITCEPMDEAWGDRVFSFVDPFGFEWEPTHPIADLDADDATQAVSQNWATADC